MLTVHVSLAELNRIIKNRGHDVPVHASSGEWWIETPYVRFVAASGIVDLVLERERKVSHDPH